MYGKSGKICGGFWRKFRRRSSSHVCTLDEHASIFPSDHCLLAIYCGIKCMPKIRHNPTQPTDVPKPCPSLIYRSIAEVTAYTSYRARQQTRVASLQSRGTTVTTHTHTHTRLTTLCPRLPGCSCTRKVKPLWILLKQQTVSGSGISWAICKSAPRS